MNKKRSEYTSEEDVIKVRFNGMEQVYHVMNIEDKDHLYSVIEPLDAVTSPVNIVNLLYKHNILQPDYWVYIDERNNMEHARTSEFSYAPDVLIKYYVQNRKENLRFYPVTNVHRDFYIDSKSGEEVHAVHIETYRNFSAIIDPLFKTLHITSEIDSFLTEKLRAITYKIMSVNNQFFDSDAGEKWIKDFASSTNPYLFIMWWDYLNDEQFQLFVKGEIVPEEYSRQDSQQDIEDLFW